MIFYLVTSEHSYTIRTYLASWGRNLAGLIRPLTYERLVKQRYLRSGTYIFSDLDRLSAAENQLAICAWEQLCHAGSQFRLLNEPGKSLLRYELLRKLQESGRNEFGVSRLTQPRGSLRFPLFVREEIAHRGSMTPLLHNQQELDAALARLLATRQSLDGLLAVEFCDTSDARGIFRKYSAFVIGERVMPRHLLFGRHWMLKRHQQFLMITDEDALKEERAYLEQNPHEEWIREIFRFARIQYGRMDYGLLRNAPQVWEINTNPMLFHHRSEYPSETLPAHDWFAEQLLLAYREIAFVPSSNERVPFAVPGDLVRAMKRDRQKRRQSDPFGVFLCRLKDNSVFQPVSNILKPFTLRYRERLARRVKSAPQCRAGR